MNNFAFYILRLLLGSAFIREQLHTKSTHTDIWYWSEMIMVLDSIFELVNCLPVFPNTTETKLHIMIANIMLNPLSLYNIISQYKNVWRPSWGRLTRVVSKYSRVHHRVHQHNPESQYWNKCYVGSLLVHIKNYMTEYIYIARVKFLYQEIIINQFCWHGNISVLLG